jgi:DNA-binding response OmpR family regulator
VPPVTFGDNTGMESFEATAPETSGGTRRRVLVVDDEEPLARLVRTYLERAGFDVTVAFDGRTGLGLARREPPDVVVLDLGLPEMDGLEVCRQLRTFSDCYVVMLTARGEEVDKLVGLTVGADDYVTKPFSPRELVARVNVMLRRPRSVPVAGDTAESMPDTGSTPSTVLVVGAVTVDRESREVLVDRELVEVTRTEFDLLAALAGRPRMVFSRRQLIDAVWGADWVGDEHLVDVHIGHLRRKLGDDAGAPRFIRTVRGVGYRMGDG